MKISACLITKNEEENIARAIASYKDIVDEIIVIDSESTDRTADLARSLGALVYTRPWTNDFAAAKNCAIDKATGDWIIFLDADEYFGDGQDAAVKQTIETLHAGSAESICTPLYNLHKDSEGIKGTVYTDRIFRNNGQIRYINKIHECLYKANGEIEKFVTDAFVIYHTGYDPKILEDKVRRNLAHLQEADAMQDALSLYFYKAECYFELKEYETCLQQLSVLFHLPAFKACLYTSQKMFRAYVFQITAMLNCRQQYSEREIARCVREAVDAFGMHPEIIQRKALYHIAYARIDEAIDALEEAFRLASGYHSMHGNAFMTNVAEKYQALARLYQIRGDRQSAWESAFAALGAEKSRDDLLYFFFCCLRKEDTAVKREKTEMLFNIENMEDLARLCEAAWVSGNSDLYTQYLLMMLKRQPALAMEDGIRRRIYFLQKNYDSMLEMSASGSGNRCNEAAALAAGFATGKKIEDECAEEIQGALCELLRAGEEAVAEATLREGLKEKAAGMDSAEKKAALARMFERFGRWTCAAELYQEAARTEQDENKKWSRHIDAARLLYLAGDDQGVFCMLREALPLMRPGNHLPVELLGWSRTRIKETDEALSQEMRQLQSEYAAQYEAACDSPLPFIEEAIL